MAGRNGLNVNVGALSMVLGQDDLEACNALPGFALNVVPPPAPNATKILSIETIDVLIEINRSSLPLWQFDPASIAARDEQRKLCEIKIAKLTDKYNEQLHQLKQAKTVYDTTMQVDRNIATLRKQRALSEKLFDPLGVKERNREKRAADRLALSEAADEAQEALYGKNTKRLRISKVVDNEAEEVEEAEEDEAKHEDVMQDASMEAAKAQVAALEAQALAAAEAFPTYEDVPAELSSSEKASFDDLAVRMERMI